LKPRRKSHPLGLVSPVCTWIVCWELNWVFFLLDFNRDYREYHTDATVKFVVKMTPEKLAQAEENGLHKVFKLQSIISTTSMVCYLCKNN